MTLFLSDRSLLDAFRRGERGAMARTYWHYVSAVERLVRFGFRLDSIGVTIRGVTPASERPDVIQETFARAFTEKARLAYNGLSTYRPYLLRIGKNLLIDRARKGEREIPTAFDQVTLDAAEAEETLDTDPEWQRLSAASREFIAALPENDRTFVRLRFEEERAQADVAATLGWTRRKVRTKESELRASLAGFLKGRGL